MNSNLGLFDMTLALSTSKINSQFAFLQKKGIIKKDWRFLSNLDGDKTLNGSDPNFAEALSAWKSSLDKALENEFDALESQVSAELEKDDPDMAKIKALNTRKNDLKTQLNNRKKYAIYDCALDCQIDPPKVWLIKGEPNKLYFEVPIKTGTLGYKKDGAIKVDKIDGSKYVFTVPIANKIVKKAEVILGDTEQDKLVLNDISDDIFRIESLFLDFQNANIAQYDKTRSVILTDSTILQIALTNYFAKIVTRTDNPYILGYSIQRKSATRDALLQPTTATYSTTHSTEERASAFNFLMQVDHHELPKDQRRGVLPKSLIEDALDKSPTVNGVMAIDFNTFKDQYLNQVLTPRIAEKVEQTLRQTFSGCGISKNIVAQSGEIKYHLNRAEISMDFKLCNRKISEGNSDKRGIVIAWDIEIQGNSHKEVEKKLWGFGLGTIGMDQRFSTNGPHELHGHPGRRGHLTILVSASTQGKLLVQAYFDKPFIGRDTPVPTYTHPEDAFKDILLSIVQAFTFDLLNLIELMKGNVFDVNLKDEDFNKLRIEDLSDVSDRIILPGSNVFTFKTLRLLTKKQDDQDAILFDIAYAPESL